MNLLYCGYESAISKRGSEFLRVTLAGTDKAQKVYFLFDSVDEFVEGMIVGNVYDFVIEDGQFPKIVRYSQIPLKVNISDFVELPYNNIEEAKKVFVEMANSIKNEEYKKLNKAIFSNSVIAKKFLTYPAAKFHHHNYRYGLLKHTQEVFECAGKLAEVFGCDKDVCLEGAFLHDIGKVREYTLNGLTPAYASTCSFGSHVSTGAEIVSEYCVRADVDPDSILMEQLKHIIRSHHLLKDWGVNVEPHTREALVVFFADYWSSREEMRRVAEEKEPGVFMQGSNIFLDIPKILGGNK